MQPAARVDPRPASVDGIDGRLDLPEPLGADELGADELEAFALRRGRVDAAVAFGLPAFQPSGSQATWYPPWYGPMGVVSLAGKVVSNSIPKAIWLAFIVGFRVWRGSWRRARRYPLRL